MRGVYLFLGIILVLVFVSCQAGSDSNSSTSETKIAGVTYPDGADPSRLERWRLDPAKLPAWVPGDLEPYHDEWSLGYGRNSIVFGKVSLDIYPDDENLYVTYIIENPSEDGYEFGFKQTHMWIGTEYPPNDPYVYKNGKWIPGHFPFSYGKDGQPEIVEDDMITEYTFTVSFEWLDNNCDGWRDAEDAFLYFMTHCTINRITGWRDVDGDGTAETPIYKTETGWGFSTPGWPPEPPNPPNPPRPPVPPPTKAINIPVNDQYVSGHNPGTTNNCYWDIIFNPDPHVQGFQNEYIGWCCDLSHTWTGGWQYVKLYSSLDGDNPWQDLGEWENLNWLINEKHKGTYALGAGNGNYSYGEFQLAYWWLLGELAPGLDYGNGTGERQLADAWTLYNDAIANGDGYYPVTGEWFAVILFDANPVNGVPRFQVNFIEVDP